MHLQEALVACQWREREGLVQGETPLGPGEPGPEVQVLSRSQGKTTGFSGGSSLSA